MVQGYQFTAKEQAYTRAVLPIGADVTGDTRLGMHDFIYLFLRKIIAVIVDVEAIRCIRSHLYHTTLGGRT